MKIRPLELTTTLQSEREKTMKNGVFKDRVLVMTRDIEY
jgi:hypothetical protein